MWKPSLYIERVAKIISMVLIPLIIFIGSCMIQQSINTASVRLEYVKMAINILREKPSKEEKTQPSLRPWATKIIDKYSEVSLTEDVRKGLEDGNVIITSAASTVEYDSAGRINRITDPWGSFLTYPMIDNRQTKVPSTQKDGR